MKDASSPQNTRQFDDVQRAYHESLFEFTIQEAGTPPAASLRLCTIKPNASPNLLGRTNVEREVPTQALR